MHQPTYKEQFDKLTRAYINDEVDPWNPCACFIGNLLNGESNWIIGRHLNFSIDPNYLAEAQYCIKRESGNLYSAEELYLIEQRFLDTIREKDGEYEDLLFTAFEQALDDIKQLHISKGEDVEGDFQFTKRKMTV